MALITLIIYWTFREVILYQNECVFATIVFAKIVFATSVAVDFSIGSLLHHIEALWPMAQKILQTGNEKYLILISNCCEIIIDRVFEE